jgi:hypothetical protein
MKIGNFLIILALVLVVILVASRLFDMRGHYDRFGVPAVLGMMAAVSVLGLAVTMIFGREDTED